MKKIFLFYLFSISVLLYSTEKDISGDIGEFVIEKNLIYRENFSKRYDKFTKNRFGKDNVAPYFDGTNDYIQVERPFENLSDGSVSMWVKFEDLPSKDAPLKIFYEIVKGEVNNIKFVDWGFALYSDIYYGITLGISDKNKKEVFLYSNFTPALGRWYHVAVTWGKGGMRIYIDGVLYAKNDYKGTFADTNNKVLYGAGTYPNSFFKGSIEGLLVYNAQLTDEEIEESYDYNVVKSEKTYYPLSNLDLSSDNKNYALRMNRFNNEKNSLKFNGISNYIELSNDLTEIRGGTVSTWVRFDDYAFNEEPYKIFFEIVSGKPSKIQNGDWGLALLLHNTKGLSYGIYNSKKGTYFADSYFFPLLGRWYNVTAVWGRGGMKLYIDGVLKAKADFNGGFDSFQDRILIGAGTYPRSFFNGRLEDIILSERVFSEVEIRKIRSDYLAKIKEKREIKIKKSDFNFIIDKKTLSFDLVAKNYRRNMIISGAITGGAGLIFTGITPLFFSFSNYYKKYYEITDHFYN